LSRNDLAYLLNKENIRVLFRENEQGKVYGITYIDHYKKSVFNGSELGKAYAANAITERLVATDQLQRHQLAQDQTQQSPLTGPILQQIERQDLLQSRRLDEATPGQLLKKNKRKKKLKLKSFR
jgi:hypothetical protein